MVLMVRVLEREGEEGRRGVVCACFKDVSLLCKIKRAITTKRKCVDTTHNLFLKVFFIGNHVVE